MSDIEFLSPCKGYVIKIEDFPDEIIADKSMGDGFGIYIEDNKIVAPMDGKITALFPTAHAICMECDNGIKFMIHIGIDSYKIHGINKACVKLNEYVKKGESLIKTNVKELKKITGNTAVAIVFLNNEIVKDLDKNQRIDYLEKVAMIEVNND